MTRLPTDAERRAKYVPLGPPAPPTPVVRPRLAPAPAEPLCAECFPVLTCTGHWQGAA